MNVFAMLKGVFTSSMKNKLAAAVVKEDMRGLKGMLDYSEYGGAGLFGLKAPVIKAHGSSNSTALFNAIRQTRTMVEFDVTGTIYNTVKKEQSQ